MALSPALVSMVSKTSDKHRLHDRWMHLEYKSERAGQAAHKLELALELAHAEVRVARIEAKLCAARIRSAHARVDAQIAERDYYEVAVDNDEEAV